MVTKLYDLEQTAELLMINPQQVRQLIWSGDLGWVDVGTGKRPRPRVSIQEIERFVKDRSTRSPKVRALSN